MSSSLTILTTCWAGAQRLAQLLADAALADAGDEVLDHLEVDVGLEQRQADLAQHLVDVGFAEAAAAAEPGEDAVEPVGERVEHGGSRLPENQRRLGRRRPRPRRPGCRPPSPPGRRRRPEPSSSRPRRRRPCRPASARPGRSPSGWGRCQVRGACSSSNTTRSTRSASLVGPPAGDERLQASPQLAARPGGEQQAEGQPADQGDDGAQSEAGDRPGW